MKVTDADVYRLDADLAGRLRLVADTLGGERLPLQTIIAALVVEAVERLEAFHADQLARFSRSIVLAGSPGDR